MDFKYKRKYKRTNGYNKKYNGNNYEQDGNNYYKKNFKKKERNLKNQHVLNNYWNIYVHDITDKDWSLESYKNIYKIETIEDFWVFFGNVKDYQRFSFFIMRKDIKPVYEDKQNKNGGSYSYMIYGREVVESFIHVGAKLIGEQFVEPKYHKEICGISLVPKKGKSILKIWLKNKNNPLKIDTYDIEGLKNGRFQPHKF